MQYPGWLQSHRDQISREEYARYERQHQLMQSIVQEFETEQSTDSDDVKRQRFERVLDIMQQMQSLGHPPKELIGELVSLQSETHSCFVRPYWPAGHSGGKICRIDKGGQWN